jgi:hypothetical protein
MKVRLLYRNADFDPDLPPAANDADLVEDLGLEPLFAALARGDAFLDEVSRQVILRGLADPTEIRYRQAILRDCLDNEFAIRDMYAIAGSAIEAEKRIWMDANARHPGGLLQRSIELLTTFFQSLEKLRKIAEENGPGFKSEGMKTLFGMLTRELDDDYLKGVKAQLASLTFRDGVLATASLGDGNFGTDYVLRRKDKQGWREAIGDRQSRTLDVDERDMRASETLSALRDRGLAIAATALGKSTDHVLSFFVMLRFELAFYRACLNLRERLAELEEPICLPKAEPPGTCRFACQGLYDLSLVLTIDKQAVGNDIQGDGKGLIVITGAHHGGKTSFLRSVGLAQLMMRAGMFVPAQRYSADLCSTILTHFRREEDPSMTSGKLDEELARMNAIVDAVRPNDLVLFNDSFASTNEREGSEIARQIVRALLESGVKVCYVTHLYDLAHGFARSRRPDALFLRAERLPDGTRTFRLTEGEPLPTSYGEDLYRRVFADWVAAEEAEGEAQATEGTAEAPGQSGTAESPQAAEAPKATPAAVPKPPEASGAVTESTGDRPAA